MSPQKRTILSLFLALGGLSLAASQAHADQCMVVERNAAKNFLSDVERGDWIVEYCGNCGEEAPGKPVQVWSTSITPFDLGDGVKRDLSQVMINGKEVDLAYTFHSDQEFGEYLNLAHTTGCPAFGSSHAIVVKPTQGPAPRPAPLPETGLPESEPPQECAAHNLEAPPPQIVVMENTSAETWAFVLGTLAVFNLAGMLAMFWGLRRRKHGHDLGRL
jgi:hypothetical protein